MEAILKELNELLSIVKIRIQKCDEERNQYASMKSALDGQKKNLAEKVATVTKREKNVTIYEDLATAQREIDLDRKQNIEVAQRLKTKEDELESKIVSHDKKIKDDQSELDRQREKLAKNSIEIDKKAANFKKEILAEITKQASK